MAQTLKYNVGDTVPGGKKIARIIGQSETVLVYLTDTDTIAYNVDESDPEKEKLAGALVGRCLPCYTKAYADGKLVFPEREWEAIRNELANSLFSGLTAASVDECLTSFDEINAKIAGKVADGGRLCYLLAASASATFMFIVALLLFIFYSKSDYDIYPACAMFAICGAFASVITRTSVVEIKPREDWRITALRGGYRIVLAVLLSSFMIVAAKANLILGIVTSTSWSLLAYSFLCGFSERFGAEILAKFEQNISSNQGKKHGGKQQVLPTAITSRSPSKTTHTIEPPSG